jgi:adenine-specific DNA-methyltransferase
MIKDVINSNKDIEVTKNNLEKLKFIFPDCFDKNGNFDIENFKENISKNTNIIKEGYSLNFLGKNYAKLLASLDTETILVSDEENNSKEENKDSNNIYISGDNIDALKHLIKSYSNKIRCIYIDPPYNTGSDGFVYNDKFNFSIDKLVNELDISEEEAKRIFDLTNSKSNSHSAWLTFMYPRLYLAKQLLSDDGIILISIDDNEYSNLKLTCDNIFGEENYIGTASWEKRTKCQNTETSKDQFQSKIEYILLYSKTYGVKHFRLFQRDKKEYNLSDDKGMYREKKLEEMSSSGIRGRNTMIFPVLGISPREGYQWKYGKDYINNLLTKNDIFKKDNKIIIKVRPTDEQNDIFDPFWSHLFDKDIYGTAEVGKSEIKKLFNSNDIDFETVKPTKLIKNLLYHMNISNTYVLDFFSGSGTTADAVLQLNAEIKDINLKYIMIQLPEKISNEYKLEQMGYKTIDELGQERIRRAAKKIKEETHANIDYGFKHYIIKDVDANTLDKLEKFEPNYMLSDETILDKFGIPSILTTWMINDGYGLTDKYEKLQLEDYEAYKCNNTVYLINPNLSSKAIKCLIEKYENKQDFDCNRIVLFGYSFNLTEIQTLKDNLKQIKNIKDLTVDVITRY